MNIAFQLALHDYSASIDVGFNAPVRSDGQTVSFRIDGAFYLAIYIKVFAARELPFNHNRLADAGHFPAGSIRRFERFHECSPLGNCSGEFDSTPMLHGSRGRVPGTAVWKRCRGLTEAVPAPAAAQSGPLKRVENSPKSTLPRAFSSQTYAKSADPNLTNNPRPHHARFEIRSPC